MKLTPHAKQQLLNNLQSLWIYVESLPVETPCTVCKWYEQGHCRRWGEKISEETKPVGCPDWSFDALAAPF